MKQRTRHISPSTKRLKGPKRRNPFTDWYDALPDPKPSLRALGRKWGIPSDYPARYYRGVLSIPPKASRLWKDVPFSKDEYYAVMPKPKKGTLS